MMSSGTDSTEPISKTPQVKALGARPSSNQMAIYTGSFDPFHLGHENIVRRASPLFGTVIVGVGENPEKKSLFSRGERVEMIRDVLGDLPNVGVEAFEGLTVHFARKKNAMVLLRGIRALADMEF